MRRGTDKRRPPGAPLTEQEKNVLRGIANGKTNLQIGKALFVSEDTVKTHVRRVLQKFGVDGRVQAVLVGIEKGVLPCPCRARLAAVEGKAIAS